jgi:CRP/FNR family cyclic AMP-dependent transcriptional regulator
LEAIMSDTLTITPHFVANPLADRYNGAEFPKPSAEQRVSNRLDFLKHIALFNGLTAAELSSLSADFIPRQFRQGEMIFLQGDSGQALYLIESGRVRIYVQEESGQETSVIFYTTGDIFGELSVIDGLPRSASAVALDDTVVLMLSRDRLRAQLRAVPQLAYNFMQALSVRVRYSTLQVGSRTLLDVPARLARQLLELAQLHGEVATDGVRLKVALTQSELAGLIGATRESINKAIGAFRKQGFILVKSNHITIIDPDALREMGS